MNTTRTHKGMHVTLWIAQGLLAALYLMAGINKALMPMEEIAKMLPWVTEMPSGLVRFIGVSELLGGLGLIIPAAFRWKPLLTPVAASGLSLIQVLATGFHISLGESNMIGMNIVLMAISLFIAWGRFKKVPVLTR